MSGSPTQPDIERVARALARHNVDYCVIGGVARFYGSNRLTRDIDLLSRGDLETSLASLTHSESLERPLEGAAWTPTTYAA